MNAERDIRPGIKTGARSAGADVLISGVLVYVVFAFVSSIMKVLFPE